MKKIINKFLNIFKCKHNDKIPIEVTYERYDVKEVTWLCMNCNKEWIEKRR